MAVGVALLLTRSVADEMKQRASAAAAEQRRKLENMFDPQVIERMRVEFQAADADGSGEIDAEEAAAMLGKLQGGAGSSPAELRKSAESLLRTMDADRNGQISFEEFCFRCASWPPLALLHRTACATMAPQRGRQSRQRQQQLTGCVLVHTGSAGGTRWRLPRSDAERAARRREQHPEGGAPTRTETTLPVRLRLQCQRTTAVAALQRISQVGRCLSTQGAVDCRKDSSSRSSC